MSHYAIVGGMLANDSRKLLLFLLVHSSLVLAEVVSVMLEGEMVWHDQMKSVGREVKVVVSGLG